MRLIGDIVRLVRSNLKMPQKDFAQRLNISQPYLCRIEHGSRVITQEVELRIRKEFAVDDIAPTMDEILDAYTRGKLPYFVQLYEKTSEILPENDARVKLEQMQKEAGKNE